MYVQHLEANYNNFSFRRHGHRVCSRHFPDGRPTLLQPSPTVDMGYKMYGKLRKRRKPPKERPFIPKKMKTAGKIVGSTAPQRINADPAVTDVKVEATAPQKINVDPADTVMKQQLHGKYYVHGNNYNKKKQ